MGGKVVVEEELSTHDEEGKVVCAPDKEKESCAVVEAATGPCNLMLVV